MDPILRFLFETGSLKNMPRSGWFNIGMSNPETVGSHIFRATLIGYVLATMEHADINKVVKMLVFHEMAESRVGDLNNINKRYLNQSDAEQRAITDQLADLPKDMKQELGELWQEFEARKTKEALIARDADKLEVALQAKEYSFQGHIHTDRWIENVGNILKTASAKKIYKDIIKSDGRWWSEIDFRQKNP